MQLRTTGPPTPFERAWHEASHALAGRARARVWLLGEYARLPHQKPTDRAAVGSTTSAGAAPDARARAIPGRSAVSSCRASSRGRGDAMRSRSATCVAATTTIAGRSRRAPQLEALVTLEPLTSSPDVAAEAWVRIGLVHFSVDDFASALRAFESAQPIAAEPSIKYLAHFNAGRSLEGLSRPDDAVRAYRQALEVVPDAESATVALASLQFMQRRSRCRRVADRSRVQSLDPSRRPRPPCRLRQLPPLAGAEDRAHCERRCRE